jgi:hypothetical protein
MNGALSDDEMMGSSATLSDDEMAAPQAPDLATKVSELERKYKVPREVLYGYARNKGFDHPGGFGERMMGSAVGAMDEFFQGVPSKLHKKLAGMTWGQNYETALDELEAFVGEHKPTSQKVLDFAGNIGGTVTGMKALGLGKSAVAAPEGVKETLGQAFKRGATNVAREGAEGIPFGAAYGYAHSNDADEATGTSVGAGVSVAAPVVFKVAGKTFKLTYEQAKKFIPGVQGAADWVNHTAAYIASLVHSGGKATKEQLYDLFANPEARRAARDFKPPNAARELAPKMQGAEDELVEGVGRQFQQHRTNAENSLTLGDLENFNPYEILDEALENIKKDPTFYSPQTRKVIENARRLALGQTSKQRPIAHDRINELKGLIANVKPEIDAARKQAAEHADARAANWANHEAMKKQYIEHKELAFQLEREIERAKKGINQIGPGEGKTPEAIRKMESNLKYHNDRLADLDIQLKQLKHQNEMFWPDDTLNRDLDYQLRNLEDSLDQSMSESMSEGGHNHIKYTNEAREHIRNHIDWGKGDGRGQVGPTDEKILLETQGKLDDMLKNNLGKSSEYQRFSDKLYREYKRKAEPLFDLMKNEKGEIDSSKILLNMLSGGENKGFVFENKMDEFLSFVEQNPQLKELPEVQKGIEAIKDARFMVHTRKAMGEQAVALGPTGQAVILAAQIGTAVGVSPVTLLAMPVVNPMGWMRIIDGLEKAGRSEVAQSLKKLGEHVKILGRQGTLKQALDQLKQREAQGGTQ